MTGPITRRQFVAGAGMAGAGLVAGCGRLPGQTQPPPKVSRIGYLSANRQDAAAPLVEAFREGLRSYGYGEGQNITIEYRFAEEREERLRQCAAELVDLAVDLIFVEVGTPAARAAQEATPTIPIVFGGVADPVGAGLVASLARPGGNATGLGGFG